MLGTLNVSSLFIYKTSQGSHLISSQQVRKLRQTKSICFAQDYPTHLVGDGLSLAQARFAV